MTTKIVLNQECNLIIALQEYVQLFFPRSSETSPRGLQHFTLFYTLTTK